MAYPRQYVNRYCTNVQMEMDEYQIAKRLVIRLSEALRIGLHAMIEDRIADPENFRVTPEIITAYQEIKIRSLNDLKAQVTARDMIREETSIVSTIQARAEEHREQQNERIRVYDTIEEKYRDITRKQIKSWYNEVPLLRDEHGDILWEQDMAVA